MSFLIRCDPFLLGSLGENKKPGEGLSFAAPFDQEPVGLSLNGKKIAAALLKQFKQIKELRFNTGLLTIYLYVDAEAVWASIVHFLSQQHKDGNLSEPPLFSKECFLEINMEVPRGFVKAIGHKFMGLQFQRLLRDVGGGELIRLAGIQRGVSDEDSFDLALIDIIKQGVKKLISPAAEALVKLNQLKEQAFIVPVLRDDYLANEAGPEIRAFSYQADSESWLCYTLPLETVFKKDTPIAIMSKGINGSPMINFC